MYSSFILSLIVIGLGFILFIVFLRKKNNVKFNLFTAIATGIISVAILVFPLLEYENVYIKALASFIYATKCIGLGQNLDILSNISLETINDYMYFILLNILFIILPLLTVGFILSFIEKLISFIRISLCSNKKVVVFSEKNDKSLLIAKDLTKSKDVRIIFANVKDKTSLNIKAITLNKKVSDIKFNTKSKITFYMISQNEDLNLNETLELIDLYKDRENIKIYIINQNEEAPVILDSTDKGKIDVEIINEKERAIFNLLDNKPLFLNSINNTISLLIVGCGNIGKEFLRDSIWCTQMPGFKLEVLVIDLIADKIKENIECEYPELLSNYNITFLNADIKSKKALDTIKSFNNINYVLVSMDNDEKNINTALLLRRLFIRTLNREPIINIWISNEYKEEELLKLVNEKGNSYNINAFGSIYDLYHNNTIINSSLEKLAIQVNLAYDPTDKDLRNYNLMEYNKRSSRASALHVKYKMYAILKEKYCENMKENQEIFRSLYTQEIEQLLTENEHDRWMAYTRSIGYVKASLDDVLKYYKTTHTYINYLARMHPCLVPFNELDNLSQDINKITGKNIDFIESDRKIVKHIYEGFKF